MRAPSRLKPAVTLLGIELPDFLPLKVEAGEFARAAEHIDVLPVRAGRGRGVRPFVIAVVTADLAEGPFPQLFALGADAQENDGLAIFAGKEDALAPDDGRGAPWSGERYLPGDVLRSAPIGGKAAF